VYQTTRTHSIARRLLRLVGAALLVTLAPARPTEAQSPKKVLTIEDYARWRSIDNSRISGDGNWVGYGLANRRDLAIRYLQFFDHYLRGAPAPRWLTEGVPFLEKDLRRDASKEIVP